MNPGDLFEFVDHCRNRHPDECTFYDQTLKRSYQINENVFVCVSYMKNLHEFDSFEYSLFFTNGSMIFHISAVKKISDDIIRVSPLAPDYAMRIT